VYENFQKLCAAIRKSFSLPAFDRYTGKGDTQSVCIRLWNDYRRWVEKKDEKDDSSPTSPAVSPAA